jgi:replication fork protection complex subunit Csm3/Swi3
MDASINDIWDLPVETTIRHASLNTELSAASPHSSTRPLFLPSDDEEDMATATKEPSANKTHPNVDALFEGLDDIDDGFQELAPALNLDALRREADARNTRAVRAEIMASIPGIELSAAALAGKSKGGKSGALDGMDGEGEEAEKKTRKPVAKLDETRLLGPNGFPQLVKDTKNFKPKGKGHEVTSFFFSPSFSFAPLGLLTTANWNFPSPSRRRTWIAFSNCTNSGRTNYTRKRDSRRR